MLMNLSSLATAASDDKFINTVMLIASGTASDDTFINIVTLTTSGAPGDGEFINSLRPSDAYMRQ